MQKNDILKTILKNIEYVCANGFNGHFAKAPYDLIIYTASHIHEPPGIREQLNVGGKLFYLKVIRPFNMVN